MRNRNNKKVKPEPLNIITTYGGQNNMPVFSQNHVPNNSTYNNVNNFARQAQQNTNGSQTMDIRAFKSIFRKKKDVHHQFTQIMQKLMCYEKYYNMQHYMLMYSGKVKLISITQVVVEGLMNIDRVSDAISLFNYMLNSALLLPYVPYLPVIKNGVIVKEQLQLSREQNLKIITAIDKDWQTQIQLPAYQNWLNGNDSVATGQMTVRNEFVENLHLMPPTSGRSTGGNALVRQAQLETMYEGSREFRDNLVDSNRTNSDLIPTLIDSHAQIYNGNIQRRNNNLDSMSREELIQYIAQNGLNNNNNSNNANNVNPSQICLNNKLQTIQFLLAQLNYQNPRSLNLESKTIEYLNELELMINNSVSQQSNLPLNPEELNLANQYICGLVESSVFNQNN